MNGTGPHRLIDVRQSEASGAMQKKQTEEETLMDALSLQAVIHPVELERSACRFLKTEPM